MVKLKPKIPGIQPSSGSFGKRTKINKVFKQLDLSLGPVGSPTIGKTRRKSNEKKNTIKQNKQRLRFRQCDCLYRLLKLIPDIIISWWEKEVPEELQKQGIRSVLMKCCLTFNLEKLLKDYLGLEIQPIELEEREEDIIIRTKLKLKKELIFKEDFYLPNPYRYAGR